MIWFQKVTIGAFASVHIETEARRVKLNIDPTVDCVFKALLGSEENKDLLIHFLNAMMDLPPGETIVDVKILNPVNERSHLRDKRTVVDVKAIDSHQNIYQVDIQGRLHSYLAERMAHNWATLLGKDLMEGEYFDKVRPVVSIWLMGQAMFPDSPFNFHRLRLSDSDTGAIIMERSGIFVVELPKVSLRAPICSESQRWQRFFVEGKDIDPDNPPDFMKTPEMEKAMKTLKRFWEKGGEDALLYLERQQAMALENTLVICEQKAREAAQKAQKEAAAAKEMARKEEAEKLAALQEARDAQALALKAKAKAKETEAKAEAMRAKLRSLGIDPDSL